MGWEDRDYNTGNGGGGDYLSNPAGLLNLSVPFGTWFGVRVRLHFWMLLTIVFALVRLTSGASVLSVFVGIVCLLTAVMLHDFGHRWATMLFGGRHDEFMLWPSGGLIFPTTPPGDGPRFVVFGAGMVVNAFVASVCWTVLWLRWHSPAYINFNPLAGMSMSVPAGYGGNLVAMILATLAIANWSVALINVLPYYYVFDGATLLQSILGPFVGGYQSINVTCIVGMVLAVPMALLSLRGGELLGMIFWVVLFSLSYTKRKQLQATGTTDFDDAIAYSAQMGSGPEPLLKKRWGKRTGVSTTQLMKQAEADRKEQGKIDAILAKVSAEGMQSLTKKERKTLSDATERQRKRAERR